MLKYGFSNLRRLETVDPVEIKPITLLVGKNSSGKSTFLRTIPLFRQSVSTKTSSPILWYGDLVDFGSFDISVTSKHLFGPISFTFALDQIQISRRTLTHFYSVIDPSEYEYKDIYCTIYIVPIEKRTRISRIAIKISEVGIEIDLNFDEQGILRSLRINDEPAQFDLEKFPFSVSPGTLFPELYSHSKVEKPIRQSRMAFYWQAEETPYHKEAFRLVKAQIDKRISEKTVNQFVDRLFYRPFLTNERLRNLSNNLSNKFRTFAREMASTKRQDLTQKISHLIIASFLPNIMGSISDHLKSIFASTLYIGPARARSERYYRYQDLSVSEIDPDGKNFPMFLNSLTSSQMESLSSWINELFGYGIRVIEESGHISIQLVEHDSSPNVTDVGYGVSQILPVLGQIWWARARPKSDLDRSPMTLVAIEQPELHLHPAHQALLADALVGETLVSLGDENSRERVNFLVETHSETLVNRLGELIGRKKISHDEVQILLFENSPGDEDITTVRPVSYDENGVLIDWPFGFFEPETR